MKIQLAVGVLLLTVASCLGYKAVVVDLTPLKDSSPDLTLLLNTKIFVQNFKPVYDIIVFPEYGLTTLDVLNSTDYKDYAIVVPEVSENEICEATNITAHKVIYDFSCAAKENKLYAVVNLLEKDKNDDTLIYNTNVVFGKKGQIVAKYRKINLCGAEENRFKAGTSIVTFKTDFDVTFGTFTCCDILHKFPAMDILKNGDVTDIAYTAAWTSKTPFTTALSIQDGYSKKTGVNLLASNYNKPSNSNGGSGIYTASDSERKTYINTVDGNWPLNVDVHEIEKRRPEQACNREVTLETSRRPGVKPALQSYKLASIIEEEYKFFSISPLKETTFHATACSADKRICCSFDGELKHELVDLSYMFMAYSKEHSGCAIVACNSTDVKTCGTTSLASNEIIFQKITVSVTKSKDGMDSYLPSTLLNSLEPSDYSFCAHSDHVEITGQNVRSLVSFGVYSIDSSKASFVEFNLMLLAACMGFIKYCVN